MRTYMRRRPDIQDVIEGVHNLCRLCLEKSEEMLPIFDEGSDGICATLSLRIMICVGLQITRDDNLPNIICSTCNKELERYYIFRKKCEVSYQKLKLHLQAIKEKERLRKAIEEKQLQEEIKIKQELINNNPSNVPENINKYVLDKNQFSEIHLLDLNGLTNVNLQTETVQENSNISAEAANYIESKEIEAQIEDADNPEISSFLSTILVQLGILGQQDETLSILDSGVNNLELMMGDGDSVVLELGEEDDDSMETSQPIGSESSSQPIDLNSIASENLNNNLSKDKANSGFEEQVMTIKWQPEEVESGGGGGGDGRRAWCGACRKWLASRGTLRRHQRVHTGEKPFACNHCGRRFAQREVLQRHRFVHLERRPFACSVCGKSFTQRGALVSHARAHPPPHARALQLHACTRCPKVFLYASSLSRHMMMHRGRTYACGACQRQFRDKSSLIRHLKGNAHAHHAAELQHADKLAEEHAHEHAHKLANEPADVE